MVKTKPPAKVLPRGERVLLGAALLQGQDVGGERTVRVEEESAVFQLGRRCGKGDEAGCEANGGAAHGSPNTHCHRSWLGRA